jgi:PBSX family phage terminase large subunit
MPATSRLNLSPKQSWSLAASDARINLWVGAVRSGKTYSSIWRWIDFVRNGPPGALMMIGKTERTLKRNVLDPLADLLGPRFKLVAGSGEAFIFGRRVYLVGANDVTAESKIRGATLAGAYGDEVVTWPESFFNQLLARLSVLDAKLFGTTNPDSPAHWLKKKFVDRTAELDMKVFHFVLKDNHTLDPGYVASLEREYVGLWRRRYLLGEWALAEGAVFDMFDPDRHVIPSWPRGEGQKPVPVLMNWAGSDYGTTNPTVYLMLSQLVSGQFLAHDEWRHDSRVAGRQMTDAQYIDAYKTWAQGVYLGRELPDPWPAWTFVDPSAASFRYGLYQAGVPGVTDADNAVLDGIRDVSTLLGSDMLLFDRDTTTLAVEEMQGYGWDGQAQSRGEDKPIKLSDHGPDTLRYIARGTRHIWRPMIEQGDTNAAA